ncbi:unnamed protein product [Urochloa decumbens]|uniref:Uncharacterized protein n=1 Tax=Urochloa decumbens TaxID=240449 RepID=A0ABC8VH98_9POAL
MDVATGPLSRLLPKLANLLQDEYNLHRGARKGIEFLHKELEFMHAVLRRVGEVPREQLEEQQRIWARDVMELSYDMEDIVDTFMVDIEGPDPPSKKGIKRIFKKMMRKVTKVMGRREVVNEINDIKERVKELAERRERYKVDDIALAKKIHVDPRLNALYTEATKIVGIEEAKEEVITMLTWGDDDQEKRIVSIAGFGGLGKTTLAKAVHDEIEGKFDCAAFVSVSRHPDMQKLLKDMLYQLDEEKFDDIHSKILDERLLIDKAIKFLKNKRYLIVIDDIWAKEPWDEVIGHALVDNNMRSTIITTTRNIDVAEHVGGCYMLKPLSDESSEMLFYGRIFGSRDDCPSRFFEVSEKILKKCGGAPLAIVTTASLLANKLEKIDVWNKVCQSIGSGLLIPAMDNMRKILLLSYDDLPSHLKTCLLYLSIFPEDYEIRKDRLIGRWVAEGFVQRDQQARDQSFHEIGESYFNELLNRSMVQPADIDMEEIGKLGFLQTLDLSETAVKEVPFIISLGELKCLRGGRDTIVLPDGLKKLTSLEVLERVAVTSECMAEELGHMTQLRVVEVSVRPPEKDNCRACTKALMGSIGKLEKIEYLHIHENDFCSLDIDGSIMEKPPGNLPRLLVHYYVIPTWINRSSLPGLSYLDISVSQERRQDIQVLGTLPCLRHLRFATSEPATERCVIARDAFPRAERCEFEVRGRGVVPSMFPPGAMPRLQDLKFHLGREQLGRDGAFSLDELAIGHLPSLRSVTVEILRKYFDKYMEGIAWSVTS